MKIWLLNHDAVSPDQPGGTRHYDFARELVEKGHEVTVFAASFHYLSYEETRQYGALPYLIESINGVRFVWFKVRPYHGNSAARLINMLDFMFKAMRYAPKLSLARPDVIVGSSVHLFAVYAAFRIAKRLNIPFVMEIRDIWPHTLVDLGFSRWHPLIILLKQMEVFLYTRAVKIISVLPGGIEHVEKYGISRENVEWIPNGVDLARFPVSHAIREYDGFVVSYAGAIGEANALETMVEAARRLCDDSSFLFRIMGSGPERKKLESRCRELSLSNIEFIPPVPKDEVPLFLSESDVLLFHLRDCSVFRFGISSNKLFDYLAAGRPVIFAAKAGNNPVAEAGAGIVINPEDPQALVDALFRLKNMSLAERQKMGEAGRKYIALNHDINKLVQRYEGLLESVL